LLLGSLPSRRSFLLRSLALSPDALLLGLLSLLLGLPGSGSGFLLCLALSHSGSGSALFLLLLGSTARSLLSSRAGAACSNLLATSAETSQTLRAHGQRLAS